MTKYKEWLGYSINLCKERKELHLTDPYVVRRINIELDIYQKTLDEYEKYHLSTIKLSEVVERLKGLYAKVEIRRFDDNIAIDCCWNNGTSILSFRIEYETNKIPAVNAERWSRISEIKWLYQLWIDQTEIIIDEVGE